MALKVSRSVLSAAIRPRFASASLRAEGSARIRVLVVGVMGAEDVGAVHRGRDLGGNPHGAKGIHRRVDAKAEAEIPGDRRSIRRSNPVFDRPAR